MSVFKDAGHLFRFAGLFVLAFLVFLVVRHYVVPEKFWAVWALPRRRHWRNCARFRSSLPATRLAKTATRTLLDVKKNGKHAHVNCEACHGALANHADDPARCSRPSSTRRCFASAATRPAPPSPRTFRRLWRPITRMALPVRLATIHTVREWDWRCRGRCEMNISRRQMLILLPAAAVAWKSVLAGTPEHRQTTRCPTTGGAC